MPAEIDEVLLKGKALRPPQARPDRLAMVDAGHYGVVVLHHVVDGEHAQAELVCLKLLRHAEVNWDKRKGRRGCVHISSRLGAFCLISDNPQPPLLGTYARAEIAHIPGVSPGAIQVASA